MKKTTFIFLLLTTFILSSSKVSAQDGYTLTLINNGAYSFSIAAVPNTSASNFPTSVQSYGFTILVPDGVTATITSSLGGGANPTFFNGTDIAQPTIDGYLITETLGSPSTLPAPSGGVITPIVTIQINGSPTAGTFYILENNSAIANAITPLKAFMQADMIDDAMPAFTNVIDRNSAAVTAPSSFSFATLSTKDVELTGVHVYPNPVKNVATITGVTTIETVELININGQHVLHNTSNLQTIDMSGLSSGIYFARIKTGLGFKTVKLIKD